MRAPRALARQRSQHRVIARNTRAVARTLATSSRVPTRAPESTEARHGGRPRADVCAASGRVRAKGSEGRGWELQWACSWGRPCRRSATGIRGERAADGCRTAETNRRAQPRQGWPRRRDHCRNYRAASLENGGTRRTAENMRATGRRVRRGPDNGATSRLGVLRASVAVKQLPRSKRNRCCAQSQSVRKGGFCESVRLS